MAGPLPPWVRAREIVKILDRRNPPPAVGLPRGEASRQQLAVLLDHLALAGKIEGMRRAAITFASSWLSAGEIEVLVDERLALQRRWDTAEDRTELAELFQLSEEERDNLRVRTIRPVRRDGTAFDDSDMETARRRAKTLMQAEYRRAKAAATGLQTHVENQTAARNDELSERALLVYEKVDGHWRSTTTVARAVKRSHKFDGQKRNLNSVRKVVNRAVPELIAAGLIEAEMRTGDNGQRLQFLRRNMVVHTVFVSGTPGQAESAAENPPSRSLS